MEQFQHTFFPNSSEDSVTHASLTLTPSKKNYGQIEEQILAMSMTYAVKKFYKYIPTSHFTDHKPLLHIFGSKSIPTNSTNLLTLQNSRTKTRKGNNFGKTDGRSVIVSIATEKATQSIHAKHLKHARREGSPTLPWNPSTPSPTSHHKTRITEDIFMRQQNQASHRQNDQQSTRKASSTNHSSIN